MDVWILALPYKLILSIPRPTREKMAVFIVFGLGLFSTICAIVRFRYLVLVTHSKDPFYDSLPINTWSVIEVNVGIVCASLPTLRPLFSKAQRDRTRYALNFSQKQGQGSKSGAILHAKAISISSFSLRSGKTSPFGEGIEMDVERPPPVPPKDTKAAPWVTSPAPSYR